MTALRTMDTRRGRHVRIPLGGDDDRRVFVTDLLGSVVESPRRCVAGEEYNAVRGRVVFYIRTLFMPTF